MAIRRRTITLSKELRIVLSNIDATTTRSIVEAWVRAWDLTENEWLAAINDLIALGQGQWPSRAQVLRATAAIRALDIATQEVVHLADFTGVTVVTAARQMTDDVALWQGRLIASQMPTQAGDFNDLVVQFGRVDANAIGAIVERTAEQVTALTKPLSKQATEAMKQALVRGVIVGDNPRTTARRMLTQVEGAFNGGLTRALTIARTESLDAYRSGAAATHFGNEDTLAGWIWLAQLDTRTCPSCWAQHGRLHELSETGPNDHQQGRCARLPKTKTWKQLGFNIAEPPDLLPDAQAVFSKLSEKDQLAIMGPVRLHALQTGAIGWADLSQLRQTKGWRDSWVPASVHTIRRKTVRRVA